MSVYTDIFSNVFVHSLTTQLLWICCMRIADNVVSRPERVRARRPVSGTSQQYDLS